MNFSLSRPSLRVPSNTCQTLLFKAALEHFVNLEDVAALTLTSKSFQNSSLGVNFLTTFSIDGDSIKIFNTTLCPSSCFSLQFAPEVAIYFGEDTTPPALESDTAEFFDELTKTKYFAKSLRTLLINGNAPYHVVSTFFGSDFFGSDSAVDTPVWPQLRSLDLRRTGKTFCSQVQGKIVVACPHLTSLDLSWCDMPPWTPTDGFLPEVCALVGLTSLSMRGCTSLVDGHVQQLAASLVNLKTLCIGGCEKVSIVGLESIWTHLGQLTNLDLCETRVTNEALDKIAENLVNLTHLDIRSVLETIDSKHAQQVFGNKPNFLFYENELVANLYGTRRRISREFWGMCTNLDRGIEIYRSSSFEDAERMEWRACIHGPAKSPYAGGRFWVNVKFGGDYPFSPPRVSFITKLYHPNCAYNGSVSFDILSPGGWSPVTTVRMVLNSMRSLLAEPNPFDPLQPEIAELYKTDLSQFEKNAREWTYRLHFGNRFDFTPEK